MSTKKNMKIGGDFEKLKKLSKYGQLFDMCDMQAILNELFFYTNNERRGVVGKQTLLLSEESKLCVTFDARPNASTRHTSFYFLSKIKHM